MSICNYCDKFTIDPPCDKWPEARACENFDAWAQNRVKSMLPRSLTTAQTTIAQLQRERDAFREYSHQITKALTGLVGGGSEMFAGRIAEGTPQEMFKADLPFCVQRIRDRFDMAHRALIASRTRPEGAGASQNNP